MQFPHSRILVFCKAPQAGKVKTRLADSIGDVAAAKIHEYLAWQCLQQVTDFSLASVELWCSPSTEDDFFRECQEAFSISLKLQQGEGLGQRMQHAINKTLADGYNPIVIGTDCPAFTQEYLQKALLAVNAGKVVIGPAEDGGYVLLGAHKPQSDIFSDMPWGTAEVFNKTMSRLDGEVEVLPLLWDVDYVDDLRRLRDTDGCIPVSEKLTEYLQSLEF